MPVSKSRRSRYRPPPSKKPKPSPPWFAWAIGGVGLGGVAMIIVNYLGLIPGTGGAASNLYLFLGLGLIALAFVLSTQLR